MKSFTFIVIGNAVAVYRIKKNIVERLGQMDIPCGDKIVQYDVEIMKFLARSDYITKSEYDALHGRYFQTHPSIRLCRQSFPSVLIDADSIKAIQ